MIEGLIRLMYLQIDARLVSMLGGFKVPRLSRPSVP